MREHRGFFFPQMPEHAVSRTQRAFEISSLVNGCLVEAGGEKRLTESEYRHQSTVLSNSEKSHFHLLLRDTRNIFLTAVPCQIFFTPFMFSVQIHVES